VDCTRATGGLVMLAMPTKGGIDLEGVGRLQVMLVSFGLVGGGTGEGEKGGGGVSTETILGQHEEAADSI